MPGRTVPPSGPTWVSCPCGAQLKVYPQNEDRRVTCVSCGVTTDFVVTYDREQKRPRISIVVPTAALSSADSLAVSGSGNNNKKKPAPKEPVDTGVVATCPCGNPLPVDPEELSGEVTCDACSRSFHVVMRLDPGTKRKVAILVAKESTGRRKLTTPPPEIPAVRGSKTVAPPPSIPVLRGSRTVAPPSASAPPPRTTPPPRATKIAKTGKMKTQVFQEVKTTRGSRKGQSVGPPPPGTAAVPCPCGHTLYVKRRDVGNTVPCPACGSELLIIEARDPQTLAPTVVAKPVPKE